MRTTIVLALLALASQGLGADYSAEAAAAFAYGAKPPPVRPAFTGCPDNPACSLECQCGCNYGKACTCPTVQVPARARPTTGMNWDRYTPGQPMRVQPVRSIIRSRSGGGSC